jgi:hypothetical protein
VRVEELIIEVRDPDFKRIGQFRPGDLVGAKFILRFNNVGAWEMKLPAGNRLGEFLRLPGYGILVTGPDGSVIFSGPTLSAKLEQTYDNLQGDWLIQGASDTVLLVERLAYPNPTTDDVTNLGQATDARLGPAETVIKDYISFNIGPNAVPSRQVPNLTIEPDAFQGSIIQGNARFEKLQELVYGLAQTGGVGYDIQQVGSDLVLSVYEPEDRTATIRMDLYNQKLSRAEYAYAGAKATRAIVGGQGEAQWRRFVEVSTPESLSAEVEWGRRVEVFKDGRNSRVLDQLTQDGLELLVDEGKTITELSVTPSDDINMRFGVDWYLGDKVTVVIDQLEAQAVVTEVGISIDADGVRIGATVGTPVALDYEAKLLAKQQRTEERVSNLERTVTGYGINVTYQPEGGTDGTQPVFSGPVITGSFNRFGDMVHFAAQVDFDNIVSFGSGQYYITLPFEARVRYTFANGHLADVSAGRTYNMVGEVTQGSQLIKLYYIGSNGRMEPFTFNSPVNLSQEDYFDISGTYEIDPN